MNLQTFLPVKFPPMTYGMTPPGHILSVRDVAALGNLLCLTLSEYFRAALSLVILLASKPAMTVLA